MIAGGTRASRASRDRLARLAGPGMLLAAVAVLIATGIVGIGRVSGALGDFTYFYAAGRVWLEGGNPYDIEQYAAVFRRYHQSAGADPIFPYPPLFAPFAMAVASLPFEVARMAMVVLNLGAIAALAWLTVRLVSHAEEPRPATHLPFWHWLLAALVVGNLFTSRLLWVGQITPVIAALLIGAWYLVRREHALAGGILLGLAAIKPQILVLPGLWLLLERRLAPLLIAGAVAAASAVYPLAITDPITLIGDWLRNLSLYQGAEANALGDPQVVGLPSFAVAAGLPAIAVPLTLLVAAAATLALWTIRRRLCPDDVLGILVALHLGLVYAHDADLVLLAPLLAALVLHGAHRPVLWPWGGLLIALLFVPNRFMALESAPLLVHWLTPTTLAALATLLYLSVRSRAEDAAAGRPDAPAGGAAPARHI